MAKQTGTEEYRRAALALANALRQHHNRAAILSSPHAAAGVTTAAIYVGRYLMNDYGVKPVVIEVNRTRPAFTRMFHLDPAKSLAATAGGSVDALECVQADPTGLPVLPAGQFGSNGHFPGLETVLCRAVQNLQNHFDFVLLDAPPVLESADVLIAGRVVSNLILVIGAGAVSQESVREACRELQNGKINLIGAILNTQKRIIPRWIDRWLGH